MKMLKQEYQNLPQHNGFKWAFYDKGFHCFSKGSHRLGFTHCYLLESDIADPVHFEFMLINGLSRSTIKNNT